MSGARVACLGEVLVDITPDGSEFPGGAPANVAFHAAAVGCDARLISRVGHDERGCRLKQWLKGAKVDVGGLQEDGAHPTGVVNVRFVGAEPSYDIGTPAAWDFIDDTADARDSIEGARVAVFGTLVQRHPVSLRSVRSLVTAARNGGGLALADVNLRTPFYDDEIVLWTLRHCDVLKMNSDEIRIVSHIIGAGGEETDLFAGLLREYEIPRGVLTCGAGGAWIFEDGFRHREPAVAVTTADTVGAGDVFTSVLAAFLAHGRSLREAVPWCAEAAAFVCSCRGATPDLPPEFIARIRAALR